MCDLLACADARIVTVALEGLENILKVGACDMQEGAAAVNMYAQFVDEAEGLEKIEALQHHSNNDIYEKAVKIMEAYFGLEVRPLSLLTHYSPRTQASPLFLSR